MKLKDFVLNIFVLTLLFLFILFFALKNETKTGVVKEIASPNKLCVEFKNQNNSDFVYIDGILDFTQNKANLGFHKLYYMALEKNALEYLNKNVKNKTITIKNYKKTINSDYYADVYVEGQNLANVLLQNGLGIIDPNNNKKYTYSKYQNIYNVKNNFDILKQQNFYILNTKNNIYHKLSCKYAFLIKRPKFIKDVKSYKPCHNCILNNNTKTYHYNFIEEKCYGDICLYFSDFINQKRPNSNCDTKMCKTVLSSINNASSTIDIAMFGYENVFKLESAIINAQNKRHVKVRIVYDLNSKNESYYIDTLKLVSKIKYTKPDNINESNDKLMHNKFIIIDKKEVITGSTNFTDSCINGFNSNILVKIKNKNVANAYSSEFEQMFNGTFHNKKQLNNFESIKLKSFNLNIYFSPKYDVIKNKIIPIVENSKKNIYIPIFYLTHKDLINALIEAKKRNVEIFIIMDATSANHRSSKVDILRSNKIKVKVENMAGKMHTKAMVVDEKYVILGSMNFSLAGVSKNDENILIFENKEIAKDVINYFMYNWERIDEKWLYKTPKPESWDSINSCSDGVDNNYDGFVDRADKFCKTRIRTR